MTLNRSHLHLPITDAAGMVYSYASIEFNDPDTGVFTTEPIYVQAVGGNPISQPLFSSPAVIEIWTENPVRLQIVATVAGNVRIQLDGMDVQPEPTTILQAAGPLRITGADTPLTDSVLMSSLPGEAAFHTSNPVASHEHEGDSAGSVVLTGEDATDFNPYQTWVGYQAGENAASISTASTALGPHGVVQGTLATIAGVGQVTYQPSTNSPGDTATVLSSEDGTATIGSTTIGAANLAKQGRDMTLVGSLNGPTSPASVPDNAVAIGPGNVTGAAGSVKIGPNHPTSSAGVNHTSIGSGNISQNNSLPWAGAQTPVAVGAGTTLAGDPSNALSSDDWFGGVGPLAIGVNSTSFNPSLITLAGTAATQTLLKVNGDAMVNGQRTYSSSSTTLGFYSNTGVVRPKIPYYATDSPNAQVTQLCQDLARIGLIYTTDVPVVTESGTHADGTPLEFAETGQSLQWKLPVGSADYRAANAFTIASNKVVLNSAQAPFPTRGLPAIYSSGLSDVSVQGRFTYNPTGTNLITDSGFEVGLSPWTAWDSSTIARVTTRAKFGDYSLEITPGAGATAARAAYPYTTAAGSTLHFSAWVYPTVAKNVRIQIAAMDSGGTYMGIDGETILTSLPLNTWTRVGVSATSRVGSTSVRLLVGYLTSSVLSGTDVLGVDAPMLVTGSTQQPYVDSTGYHPHDRSATGIVFRAYNALSGGLAVPTGYLIGRTEVRSFSGNSTTFITNLSTPANTGDLLQADCSGTSVTVRINGASVASFTDSTLNTRVKHGFRIADTTSAYAVQVFPFGF